MGQGSRSKVQEVLASLTEQVIDKLKRVQEGEKLSPFESPWEGDPMPRNFTTNEYYHGVNIFGLWVAAETNNYTSNEWCTPKQLLAYARKNKIDVSFKGQKTTPIIKWVDNWEPKEKKTDDGTPNFVGFWRVFGVLNRCQINGLPTVHVSDVPVIKTRNNIDNWITDLNPIIKDGGDRAYYHPRHDYIGMPDINKFKSEDHYWNVLFHELTHWTAHETRLDRTLSLEKKDYAFEELIAEMGSALISSMMGVPSKINHESYINGYIKLLKYDYLALRKAATQAGQAYEYLLNPEKRKEVA